MLEQFSREPLYWRVRSGEANPVSWLFGETPQSQYSATQRIIDCHNKSTAIYLFDPQRQASHLVNGIWKFVDIWLYRQWFRPYESDIEHGRYVAKSMSLVWDAETGKPTITDLVAFHTNLCQDLSNDIFTRLPPEVLDTKLIAGSKAVEKWPSGREDLLATLSQRYVLQPLFQAVFIVMDQTLGPTEGPLTSNDIGDIPVSLMLTGCTKGLSGPISFDSLYRNGYVLSALSNSASTVDGVRVTLKNAIQFIIDLENREKAVFGLRPSPSLLDDSVELENEARRLGWDSSTHGELPLDQPTSTWVDKGKYREWTGQGALYHARSVYVAIRFMRAIKEKRTLQEDWWWLDSA